MGYYIQSYGSGHIEREGSKYKLVVKGKDVGTYNSVHELAEANPLNDGKQDQSSESSVDATASTDVATASDTQSAPKKTTRRKSTKKS